MGFLPLKSDSAIYRNEETEVILTSYIDDFLIFTETDELIRKFINDISSALEIDDLGIAE